MPKACTKCGKVYTNDVGIVESDGLCTLCKIKAVSAQCTTEEESERNAIPTFHEGDRVRHKVSGEEGIVDLIYKQCVNPEHTDTAFACFNSWMKVNSSACRSEPSGTYRVSYGFGKYDDVRGCVLEKMG